MADRSLNGYKLDSAAEPNTEAGDFWLVEAEGNHNLWPVVICDEDMVKSLGMLNNRPESASRPIKDNDKYWRKPFRIGGNSVNKRSFPAMYLHSMEFRWISWCDLKPLDIQIAEYHANALIKSELSTVYQELLEQYERRNLQYWIDKLVAHQYDEGFVANQEERIDGRLSEKRKRRPSAAFNHPRGYGDAMDDEESLSLPSDNTSQVKVKDEIIDERSSQEIDALYRDPDDDHRYRKSSKLNATGRFTRPETPVNPRSDTGKLNDGRAKIYVGNPHEVLIVRKDGLEQSALLCGLLTHNTREGWYVMAPLLSSISARDFKPVADFLDHGEYRPNLLDDETEYVRLENVTTKQQRANEILRCGVVYSLAEMIELPNLQSLAFRKLRALGSSFSAPFPSFELLSVVQLVFNGTAPKDLDMHSFFVNYIAKHFWNIMESNPPRFAEIMKENEHLSRSVFGKLAEASSSVEGIKHEGIVVKEEDNTATDDTIVTKKEHAVFLEPTEEDELELAYNQYF